LSYTPREGERDDKKSFARRQVLVGEVLAVKKSGQQTPRRWGWGTPLKKRAATRMR